jgi:hypothetical protein
MAAAAKSNTLNNTLRLVFSLAHAVLLVFCVIFIFVIQGETQMPSLSFLLMVVPGVSFAIGLLMNSLIQYLACSKLNGAQIAMNSLFGPGFSMAALVLLWLLPVLESPVISILPETLTPLYKKAISEGFYVFWAGLYAQVIASGFLQVCPS